MLTKEVGGESKLLTSHFNHPLKKAQIDKFTHAITFGEQFPKNVACRSVWKVG